MVTFFVLLLCVWRVYGYFTLPGKCPEKVVTQEDFSFPQIFGKWYQVYHYSSDQLNVNNCAYIEIFSKPHGTFINFSRLDADLVQRFSYGTVKTIYSREEAANIVVNFHFDRVPKNLKDRSYPFTILATNYDYFFTAYSCSYSALINKHFIYVWILSKIPLLADIYKDLAVRPLNQIGVASTKLLKDEWTDCEAKRYNVPPVEPVTFRYPVVTHIRLSEYHEPKPRRDSY